MALIRLLRHLPLVLAWLPHVVAGVTLFEGLLDKSTPGSEKKAAVMAWLSTIATESRLPWGEAAVEAIGSLIDAVVSVMNFVGAFVHKADEAPEVLAAPAPADAAVVKASVTKAVSADPELDAFLARLQP